MKVVDYANGGDFDQLKTQEKVSKLVAKESAIKHHKDKKEGKVPNRATQYESTDADDDFFRDTEANQSELEDQLE